MVFEALKTDKTTPPEIRVGRKLRELRNQHHLSLRALADRSGLNINTLALIENGRSSPSVSTLQQLAVALEVPVAAFFETRPAEKKVVFTPAGDRPKFSFGSTELEHLGKDLTKNAVQPFILTLRPGMGIGEERIVHTGYEFIHCLKGNISYQIEEETFSLHAGDSLLFEAHLPHCWGNEGNEEARFLLVLFPADHREEVGGRHFLIKNLKQEIKMKIAVITDDGKQISQHFGRAPYYLVLTIEEGKVIEREMRDKMGHGQFSTQPPAETEQSPNQQGHGMDSASHNKHISMADTIADCQALICGGMGMGAYESMRRLNIQPLVTDLTDVKEAVQAFLDGKLIDHTELLH